MHLQLPRFLVIIFMPNSKKLIIIIIIIFYLFFIMHAKIKVLKPIQYQHAPQ